MADHDAGSDLTTEKMELEVEKLREEVKKARRENRIWIIGLLIAVAGFGLGNLNKIKDLVIHEPRVRLVVEDLFIKQVGMVRITHTSGKKEIAVETSVSEVEEWLTLSPGSYTVEIFVDDKPFHSQKVLLKPGESEPVIVPQRDTGSIRIAVKNHTPNPKPGSQLDLSIESSGNGFLWVYDYGKDGKVLLIYPDPNQPGAVAKITAGKTFTIPDTQGVNITTNDQAGQEELLFIVTSSPSIQDAMSIASRISEAVTSKASAGAKTPNWGIARLQYEVSW